MEDDKVLDEYGLMRTAKSHRQLRWIAAYNSNPELAGMLLDIFDMPEEDIRFIMRNINSLKDSLRFYKDDIRPKKKKRTMVTV